jgi:hypothetical protein
VAGGHGGRLCPTDDPGGPEWQTRVCNPAPCIVDCEGSWGGWEACSLLCGGGTQNRTYVVTVKAAGGAARYLPGVMHPDAQVIASGDWRTSGQKWSSRVHAHALLHIRAHALALPRTWSQAPHPAAGGEPCPTRTGGTEREAQPCNTQTCCETQTACAWPCKVCGPLT